MIKSVLNLMALTSLICSQAFGSVVYNNTTTDTFDNLAYAVNGFTQVGDQIHLAGTDRQASLATVQFYNNGTIGTFNAILRLFAVGAPVGAQIGSNFVNNAISAPAGDVFNVSFILLSLLTPLPDDLIFTVSISSQSAGVDIIGLEYYLTSSAGTSNSAFSIANNGTSFIQTATPSAEVMENSHMLPHGARCTDSPRRTTPAKSSTVPSHIVDMPMLPDRRPGASAPSSGPPTVTSTLVATATPPPVDADAAAAAGTRSRPRMLASDQAKAIIATV